MSTAKSNRLKKTLSERRFDFLLSSILTPTIGRLWDMYALVLMRPVMNAFIPWTGVAIRPYTALSIINDIYVNDRKSIVELGAGVSTILIAQALKNKGRGTLISFEDSEEWASFLNNELQRRELNGVCEVIHAPLKPCEHSIGKELSWYQEEIIHRNISEQKIDLLLVDGPKASGDKNQLARFPAIDVLKRYFSDSYSIYLDDIRRKGEQEIIEKWNENLKCKVIKSPIKGNFSLLRYGHSYYTRP